MVVLVEKLCYSLQLSSKLENHNLLHHHHDHRQFEALSASSQAFQDYVSNSINKLSMNSKPGSEFMSLSWIHQCLELLSNLNRGFASLVTKIDYPMRKWDITSIDEYLSYSLKLLELLNSITSLLSHLGQGRISISHALSLIDSSSESTMERLKAVELMKNLSRDIRLEEMEEGEEKRLLYGQENLEKCVLDEALMVMKRNGYWVCVIVLFGLSGDIRLCLEMKKLCRGFLSPSVMASMEKNGVAKEVREVNEEMAYLVAAVGEGESGRAAGDNLEGKLEVMEKLLDGICNEADGLFSEILAGRNELLDCVRQMKP